MPAAPWQWQEPPLSQAVPAASVGGASVPRSLFLLKGGDVWVADDGVSTVGSTNTVEAMDVAFWPSSLLLLPPCWYYSYGGYEAQTEGERALTLLFVEWWCKERLTLTKTSVVSGVMETTLDQEESTRRDPVQELVELADCPPDDPKKFELFLQVRTILAKARPELDSVFRGLFEKGRHERDARTFLGRIREVLGTKLTKEEFRLLLEARDIPGFSLIQKLIEDATYPEEKPPVTERVIREIPVTSPTPMGGRAPMCCPNIGGLPD